MTAPTSFGLAFFLRVGPPGLFTSMVFMPLLPLSLSIGLTAEGLALLLGLAATAGILLFLLDTAIYGFLEGRLFWPARLRDLGTRLQHFIIKRMQSRLDRLQAELGSEETKPQPDRAAIQWKKREAGLIADSLLDFPWDEDGEPRAIWPTRIGNVLATWEYYPETRYGMDTTFYWYRLWLITDDNDRKEIDTNWALAQVWTYVAVASLLGVFIYGLLSLWFLFLPRLTDIVDDAGRLSGPLRVLLELRLSGRFFPEILSSAQLVTRLASLAVVSGVAFVIAYRLAVMQHRVSGEFYKALFDIHRHELVVVADSAGTSTELAGRLNLASVHAR